jgi:DNA-binding beta-propeller fold protein YncE
LIDGGRILAVANEGSSSVAFVETIGLAEIGRALVGDAPVALLVDRTERRIFVACQRGNRVDEIELDRNRREWRVVRTAGTDPGPFRLQFNRAGTRLFVAQNGSPYLLALDAESLAVASRPFVGPGQSAIRVDPATDRLFLARRGTGSIEVFDPFSLLAIERLPLPGDASYMTLDRETAGIVAVIPKLSEVVRVSPISRQLDAAIPAGPGVAFVALFGEP